MFLILSRMLHKREESEMKGEAEVEALSTDAAAARKEAVDTWLEVRRRRRERRCGKRSSGGT